MQSITVRRWVPVPPLEVWRRILDLDQLVIDDRALDLEDVVGDLTAGTAPGIGARATITRRSGAHMDRITVHVEDRIEPEHLTVTMTTAGERWLVTITVEEIPSDHGSGSDVRFHAERDPASRPPGHLAVGRRRIHRAAESLTSLLEGLARQLDRSAGGPVTAAQRIAPGRYRAASG
ncbi:SRPBCC family protein [Nitriliruptor alkaliphilus]|uniref:SRPBCC family protein n=1 Tax=Nitriliruptor alkaliphilus TaxID=427918 RepID=UPI0006978A80|nr:SRPBCC family protein [Nitriliruptor alkaliphilus]